MALYELRQYKVRAGKMSEWIELMEGEIIPYVVSRGMVVTASFRSVDDDTKYIWLRRFENEADLDRMYKEIYESEHWVNSLKPRIGELLIREEAVINRLEPTKLSPIQ
jgi:hypothetical protein